MSRIFSFSTLLALPVVLGALAAPAQAASPDYCTFTTPASFTCPGDEKQAVRTPAPQEVQTAASDHCIATSPASSACPVVAPSALVAAAAAPVRVSSK
jgi:hypothetical protein